MKITLLNSDYFSACFENLGFGMLACPVNTGYGMLLPNRHGAGNEYRYGYQGSEKDDEVSGEGNSLNSFFRQYDPRLGKFKSIDPMSNKFPWQSPYVGFDNNPVLFADSTGGETDPINPSKSYLNAMIDHDAIELLLESASYKLGPIPSVVNNEKYKQIAFKHFTVNYTVGILLYEFATGTGEQHREFGVNTPFSKDLANDKNLKKIVVQQFFKQNFYDGNSASNLKEQDIVYSFSPDATDISDSYDKHVNSTQASFFLGGWTGKASPIFNDDGSVTLTVTVYNETSRNFLMLHLAENYTREDNKGSTPLGTISQTITFEINFTKEEWDYIIKTYESKKEDSDNANE